MGGQKCDNFWYFLYKMWIFDKKCVKLSFSLKKCPICYGEMSILRFGGSKWGFDMVLKGYEKIGVWNWTPIFDKMA